MAAPRAVPMKQQIAAGVPVVPVLPAAPSGADLVPKPLKSPELDKPEVDTKTEPVIVAIIGAPADAPGTFAAAVAALQDAGPRSTW